MVINRPDAAGIAGAGIVIDDQLNTPSGFYLLTTVRILWPITSGGPTGNMVVTGPGVSGAVTFYDQQWRLPGGPVNPLVLVHLGSAPTPGALKGLVQVVLQDSGEIITPTSVPPDFSGGSQAYFHHPFSFSPSNISILRTFSCDYSGDPDPSLEGELVGFGGPSDQATSWGLVVDADADRMRAVRLDDALVTVRQQLR